MKSAGRNFIVAALVLSAFATAGLKVFNRPPAATFDVPIAQVLSKAPLTGAENTPDFQAAFVSSVPGKAVHAPSLVELGDGSLRAVWFSGSREGAGDVTIQTAVLSPASRKWGAESSLIDRAQLQRGLQRYVKKIGNPVIARAPDGSLQLWLVNVSLGGWAGSAITWSRSVNDGASWSAPHRLVTSPFLNISTLVKAAPVMMTQGQLSLPVYHEFIAKFAEILRLDAAGRILDKVRISGSQTSLQPVVLADGALTAQAFMRASQGGRVMRSTTADAGQSWSTAEPMDLPNPDSALAGLVLQDGARWLALNPTESGREMLALTKPGITASRSFPLEPLAANQSLAAPLTKAGHAAVLAAELTSIGASDAQAAAYVASAQRQLCGDTHCTQEFSYPFMLQTSDGTLHLVYTWHRTRIKHVQLKTPSALVLGLGP